MAGLRPAEIDELVAILRDIQREEGMTILLTEHVMRAVMALRSRLCVLHHGQVVARGARRRGADPAVLACYLGEETPLLMLSVSGLDLFYGEAQALAGISLDVPAASWSR